MKKTVLITLLVTVSFSLKAQDLISGGANSWIFHTPEDRTSLLIAPKTNSIWDWTKATQFYNNGNVSFIGNVGIGTTTPYAKLTLSDNNQVFNFLVNKKLTGTWPAVTENRTMTMQSSGVYSGNLAFATGNSERMRITAGGKVGIGTETPSAKLDVKGDGVFRATDNSQGVALHIRNTNEVNSFTLRGFTTKGQLKAQNGLPFEIEDYNGNTWFHGQNGGKVGIGTKTPSHNLDISNNSSVRNTGVELDASNYTGAGTSHAFVQFKTPNYKNNNMLSIGGAEIGLSNADGSFYLTRKTNEGVNASGIVIDKNANVGIGTASPTQKLEVNQGYLKVSGSIYNTVYKDAGVYGGNHLILQADNSYLRLSAPKNYIDLKGGHGTRIQDKDGVTHLMVKPDGKVGIGTVTTGSHRLAVEGSIGAREIKVEATGWSDFVFERDYYLPTLVEVERHIKKKGHLKDIPSAKEVENNGFYLGEMDARLLQKIEELTLYTIQQEKEIGTLKTQKTVIEKVAKENKDLKKRLERLEKLVNKLL